MRKFLAVLTALLTLCCVTACSAFSPQIQGGEGSAAASRGRSRNVLEHWEEELEEKPAPQGDRGEGELDGEDIRQLGSLLESFWSISGWEWDYRYTTAQEILDALVVGFASPGYSTYFGILEPIYGEDWDPRRRFVRTESFEDQGERDVAYYYKIPADNADWIIKHIFHVEPDHSVDTDTLYYHEGNYYRGAGDAGFIGHEPEIRMYEILEDGKVMLTCDYSIMGEYDSTHYMVGDLTEIDGERQWTFYYFSNQFMDLSGGAPVYHLQPDTPWFLSGTLYQGANPLGTEHFLELVRPMEVVVEGQNLTISAVGATPYVSEYYTADWGDSLEENVSLRGDVSIAHGESEEPQVILQSAFLYTD